MKKLLVLYRELAGYVVTNLNFLSKQYNVQIDIVAYPIHQDAPFDFFFEKGIRIFKREDYSDQELLEWIKNNQYDLIFCGGWIDKGYLRVVAEMKETPSVVAFDKQWQGSLKDVLAAVYLRWKVRPLFDYAFVPGKEQEKFARKIGFQMSQIFLGVYTCETRRFDGVYQWRKSNPEAIKKQVFFAGRYVIEKDVEQLWSVAEKLLVEFSDWEFHFIGKGPLWDKRLIHERAVHHGFQDGENLERVIRSGAVFVLPSVYEPWGVVVNEFAAAGYPLVLSDKVGARTGLTGERNALIFPAGSAKALEQALRNMMNTTVEERTQMGDESHQLSMQINEENYAAAILKMMR